MTNQQIQFQALQETKRANLANELERSRANLANEKETARSNVAKEQETNRANVAKETETKRANKAKETQGYVEIGVDAIGRRLDRTTNLVGNVLKAVPNMISVFGG